MARHNREGQGVDQRGFTYHVSYQPDWLRSIKVTRVLDNGRQSTKTLFRNPSDFREGDPGDRVRTGIASEDQDLEFELSLLDPGACVKRIRVTCMRPGKGGRPEEVEFTFDDRLPPNRR